jgi:hypothetical protein
MGIKKESKVVREKRRLKNTEGVLKNLFWGPVQFSGV